VERWNVAPIMAVSRRRSAPFQFFDDETGSMGHGFQHPGAGFVFFALFKHGCLFGICLVALLPKTCKGNLFVGSIPPLSPGQSD
jgi:hypothetical protein